MDFIKVVDPDIKCEIIDYLNNKDSKLVITEKIHCVSNSKIGAIKAKDIDVDKLIDLLNEISEENSELKMQVEYYEKYIDWLEKNYKCIPNWYISDPKLIKEKYEEDTDMSINLQKPKGCIIVGYQGIGKSTLANSEPCFIDLESGNFWIDGERANDWYKPYCKIAVHLAEQGNIVFTSSHKVVRDELILMNSDVDLITCFPDESLKDQWTQKLKARYLNTHLDKDYKAWKNAEAMYIENIKELREADVFQNIIIPCIPYDLKHLIYKEYINQR